MALKRIGFSCRSDDDDENEAFSKPSITLVMNQRLSQTCTESCAVGCSTPLDDGALDEDKDDFEI